MSWFSISAVDGPSKIVPMGMDDEGMPDRIGQIAIHGPIADSDFWGDGVATAHDFIQALKDLGTVDEIQLSLHSPGGMVTEGWAIYNALKNHPARIVAQVEGLAASMASVIAMAADSVSMPRNSYLMIHEVSGGAHGNAKDLRKQAELIEQMNADIIGVYATRSGLSADDVAGLMAEETWMNGQRAHELGFADFVMEEQRAAAISVDMLKNFSTVPVQLVALAAVSDSPEVVPEAGALEPEPGGDDAEPESAVDPGADAANDQAPAAGENTVVTESETVSEEPEAAAPVDPAPAENSGDQAVVKRGLVDLLRDFLAGTKPGTDGAPANLAGTISAGDAAALTGQVETLTSELTSLRDQVSAQNDENATAEAVVLESLEAYAPDVLNTLDPANTTLGDLVALMAKQLKGAHEIAAEIVATQVGLTAAEADAQLPSPIDGQTWDSMEEAITAKRSDLAKESDPKRKHKLAQELKALRNGNWPAQDEAA